MHGVVLLCAVLFLTLLFANNCHHAVIKLPTGCGPPADSPLFLCGQNSVAALCRSCTAGMLCALMDHAYPVFGCLVPNLLVQVIYGTSL